MRPLITCLCLSLLVGVSFGFGKSQTAQDKAKEGAGQAVDTFKTEGATLKNPVAPTADGLAAAKKSYGYDCAMCHGAEGDGKGDMVESMKLTLKDWRNSQSLEGITDGEMFLVVTNGRGKMTGEGKRLPPEKIWGLVNYVRHFAKKDAAKAADSAPKQ